MKNIYLLPILIFSVSFAFGQDEGDVVVKKRFERDKAVYFSLGPSFTVGKNLGDYSAGFNFEAGFLKRVNKLVSIGPNLSYLFFAYDATKTFPDYYVPAVGDSREYTINLTFTGGDISIVSLGFNLKVNFIPVSDNSKFSVYGFANPFIASATRSEIEANAIRYVDNTQYRVFDDVYDEIPLTKDDVPGFKKITSVTGGLGVGFGVEFRPAKMFSFFGQVTFNYTLPISYVATEEFLKDEKIFTSADNKKYYYTDSNLNDDKYPSVKKGFSVVSIKFGTAFNF